MAEDQEFVIVDQDNNEHVFPAGMDPKKAAEIVRGKTYDPSAVGNMMAESRRDLARGTSRDDSTPEPESSPVMGALSRAAHPTTTGDMISLVAPQLGSEMWVPGVRMLKSALRFASEEPKGTGLIQNATGYLRGMLRGATREATGKGVQQESPRLVKAGTDKPVALPVARSRAPTPYSTAEGKGAFRENVESALDKALTKTPGAKEALPELDKAIQEAKREGDAAWAASRRIEEQLTRAETTADREALRLEQQQHQETMRIADKAVADASKMVDKLQGEFGTATSKQTLRETDAAIKAAEEKARAAKISAARGEPKKMVFRVTQSAPTPGGGKQSVTTTYRPRATGEGGGATSPETPVVPTGGAPTGKVAPYTHHSTDMQPRFSIEGSDVTTAEAQARGYTPGEVPAGAGKESSTAARDAAMQRRAARDAMTPEERSYEDYSRGHDMEIGISPQHPSITVDPKSVEALGGTSPMQDEALRRVLKVKPGAPLTMDEQTKAYIAEVDKLRTELGAEKAAKKLGLDVTTVRSISGGQAGLGPAGMMRDMDKATAGMDVDQLVEYLNRNPKLSQAAYNYITSLIKQKTPF